VNSAAENDLLLGASAITEFVNELTTTNVSRSQVYHWIESGHLPAGRLGRKVLGSKKRIREHFERLTGGG
jgi:excisionase family DNA binding protein